jgi:hypothetical protein
VTGDEEYEIDTFTGLSPEARAILVQYKFTTLNDLSRFKEKWLAFEDLEADQKELLQERVTVFEAEEAERAKLKAVA